VEPVKPVKPVRRVVRHQKRLAMRLASRTTRGGAAMRTTGRT